MLFRGKALTDLSDEELIEASDYAQEHMLLAQRQYAINRAFLEEIGLIAQRRIDADKPTIN